MHYRYFFILVGLRGCYMPDTVACIQVSSRRELREYIANEADMCGENTVGLSQKNISWAANHAWKRGSKGAVLPYGERGRGKAYNSIDISHASRYEYLEHAKHNHEG